MRIGEAIIDSVERAREDAFRYARAVPITRLEWKPLGVGQSVLSMCRELTKTPDWAFFVLTDAKLDDPENAAAQQKAEMEGWKTVDDCETACREKLVRLYDLYRSYSDEELARTKWLTFNGGRDHTILELLD